MNAIGTLTPVTVKSVLARNLREGMTLVDEFDCPVVIIDHRLKTTVRGTGQVAFLVEDLEGGGWRDITLRPSKPVRVMA